MKLIISAMKEEIEEIINKIDHSIIKDKYFEIYKYKDFLFVISGIGTLNANICITYILNKFSITEIYNLGMSGSISKKISVFSIAYIENSVWFLEDKKIQHVKSLNPKNSNEIKTTLLTSDFFIEKNSVKEILNRLCKHPLIMKNIHKAKIVDMEFAAFNFVANKYNVPIYGIKVISDNIYNENSNSKQFYKNMIYCKKILRKFFLEQFSTEL